MLTSEQIKKDYDDAAFAYNDYGSLPHGTLESQLIAVALKDCKGLSILDLGGGTGLHAREAIELGASAVDVVDISPEMLKNGENIEQAQGRDNAIRFFEGDVSKPLSHLPLRPGGYDVVMGIWIFNFAGSVEGLEGMFRNITDYLKPGGTFIGVHGLDPRKLVLDRDTYGAKYKWIEEVPDGVKYLRVLCCTPPIEFEGVSLDIVHSKSKDIYDKFKLSDVEYIPYEEADAVKANPEFWKLFIEQPSLTVVKAIKT